MKKILLSVMVLFYGLVLFSPAAYAVNIFSTTCGTGGVASKTAVCSQVNHQQANNGLNNDPILTTMKKAIEIMSYVIGVAAIIVVIVAAIQLIVSSGESQAVANARNMIIYALVGIIVAVLAQLIVVFVLKNVG